MLVLTGRGGVHYNKIALCSGVSVAALLLGGGQAAAQCVPNPAQGNSVTTCSGTEAGGLVVTGNPTVNVQAGAVVQAPNAGASAISVTASDNVSSTTAKIVIANTASVVGAVGIDAASPAGNRVWVNLDNSGTIASTNGGLALRGTEFATGRFDTILNRADGRIGAIRAQVGTLTNQGLIDGGALGAFSDTAGPLFFGGQGMVVNSGTMRSGGAADTVFFYRAFNPGPYVRNSGLIVNEGTGRAIAGQTILSVVNEAAGRIVSPRTAIGASAFVDVNNSGTITGGIDAIASGGNLSLVNRGTINGTVRAAQSGSTIDNRGGTINGALLLGGGDDVFIGDIANLANPIGTITGTLDAGAGNDLLRFTFMQDTTLDTAISLPATIERLGLRVGGSSTLTLAGTFASTSGLALGGGDQSFFNTENRFVLGGSITTQGSAVVTDSAAPGGFGVINTGTISATLAAAGDFAVNLSRTTFVNSGTINATGGGGAFIDGAWTMANTGSITADGIALAARNVAIDNSGTLRSVRDVGLDFQGLSNAPAINTGQIQGAITGARISSGLLTNSGTITGTQSGIELGGGSVVENLAGGVIGGGFKGVAPSTAFNQVSGARIFNAGTIDGNVDVGNNGVSNTFVALAGGRVNGDINLGSDNGIFATSLVNDGPGEFAGLTGRVTGTGRQTLRYLITADAAATVERKGIFTALAYDLSNGAKLTLTAPAPLNFGLSFSGTGTVDLTADMSSTGEATLLDLHQTSLQKDAAGVTIAAAIDLTSRGAITVVKNTSGFTVPSAISLAVGDVFTNAGLISVSAALPPVNSGQTPFAAIRALGGTVTNTGTIRTSGAYAVRGSTFYGEDTAVVVNAGVIEQLPGSVPMAGIADVGRVINSGRISTLGPAITMSGSTAVINSGSITSTLAPAIDNTGFSGGRIDNRSGALIAGGAGQAAMRLGSGSIVQNAGTIQGDVLLGYNQYGYPNAGPVAYVNRGGVLNGNLWLTGGDDLFVALDGATGVTGSINAGAGSDMFVLGYTSSATADLDTLAAGRPSGFERSGVGAYGAGTTVTLASASRYGGSLLLVGDGSIVNTATIDAAAGGAGGQNGDTFVRLGSFLDATNEFGAGSSLDFTNKGRIESGIAGGARIFNNQGYIGPNPGFGTTLGITANNANGLIFRNSGMIAGGSSSINQWSSVQRTAQVSFDNSGTIDGNLSIDVRPDRFQFTNTGRIAAPEDNARPLNVAIGQTYAAANASEAAFVNAGTIVDGMEASVAARAVTFANSGTLGSSQSFTGLALYQTGRRLDGQMSFDQRTYDQDSLAFANSGEVLGRVDLRSRAPSVTIENRGSVSISQGGFGSSAFTAVVESSGDQTVSFTNAGSIVGNGLETSALFIGSLGILDDGTAAGSVNASIVLTNTGTIAADGGALFLPKGSNPFGFPSGTDVLSGLTAVSISAVTPGDSAVTIVNAAGGTISATGSTKAYTGLTTPVIDAPAAVANLGSLAISVAADSLILDNAGTIRGSAGGLLPPGTVLSMGIPVNELSDGYLAGAIQTFGSVDTLTNRATGTITGSIDLGDFDDVVVNYGRIDGDLFLRAGNDSLTHALSGSITGLADGGDGIDRLMIDLTGGGTLDLARFVNFEDFSFTGSGSLGTDAPLALDTVSLAGGDLQIAEGQTLATAGPNTVTGTDANESITNAGTIAGNVTLLGGDDSVGNSGTIAGSVLLSIGNDRLANTGAIGGGVDFGDGNDTLTGGGTIAGPVQMGAGDDTASLPALAGAAQGIDGGTGTDLLLIDAATTATLTAALADRLTNFEAMQAAGTGTVNAAGVFAVGSFQIDGATVNVAAGSTFGTAGPNAVTGGANADRVTNAGTLAGSVALGDGANQIANTGTIAGGVTTGSGNDSFANGGVVGGNVNLGGGNNSLTVMTGGQFNGTVAAGTGTDQLIFQTSGTYQAPMQINGAAFTGFETLQNAGGTSRLTGSFTGGVDVTGGYLLGALGSTITGNVNVGTGAQFGTSGVVNGNVAVGAGGTLAPGSSPGVMTVNGSVVLAAGSSSIFEFVPAPGQSDQLLISGSLTIGANTTLTMTGTRPLTPGVNYDLIVANGGITGTFATVNQSATIGGFLRYTPNRLQLMGTFLTPTGVTVQQASAIGYVNTVLISGQASAPLLAAVPSLLRADGAANPAVFNLLTAEAYASASQLTVENALGLAQAGRSGIVRTTRDEAGAFVFAQGMGDRRTLGARVAIGTSRSRSESWGVLGGIGYGVDGASIGAFIGHTDSRQRIAALGGATDADGIVAGLAGHFAIAGFEFGLLGAYDWTRAETGRSVPGGRVDSSRYRLGSLLIDASVGANIPLGTGWAVRPEAGVTQIRGRRGAAREIGSTAFALDTDRDRFGATFVDTSIALRGGLGEGAAFHPWLQAGVRRQIAGGAETASAGFVGTAARFTSFGTGRKEKVITAGAGASYDIGGVTLFAAYQGEFGGGNGYNGNVGVRFGF